MSQLHHLRDRLHTHGFAHATAMLTAHDLAVLESVHNALIDRAGRILADTREAGQSLLAYYRISDDHLIVVPEASDPLQVCRFECLCGASSAADQFVARTLIPVVEAMAGERCVLFKDKCNEKTPGGGAFAPHQDFAAYRSFPPPSYITAMVALDDATLENGCLYFADNYRDVARQSKHFVEADCHGFPLLRHAHGGPSNGCILTEIADAMHWIPLPARRGDVVIFDAFVPHYSKPNHSRTRRRALFFTFNATRHGDHYSHYYRSKRERYDDPSFHMATPTEHATSHVEPQQ